MSKRAAIYTRISRDREGHEMGVQRQEEDCRALAARLGLDVVAVYADNDISASTKSRKARPAYQAMLAAARAGQFGVLLSYSNSRLTRRPMELEGLIQLHEQTGIRLSTVVSGQADLSTADGRQYARIQASIDAGEAERTAERAKRAKAQAAESGLYRGGPRPYGYESDGVTVLEDEARFVRMAADSILAGHSLNATVRALTAAGARTTRGREWKPGGVRIMLLRPRNAALLGNANARTTGGPAVWPALLDEETWRAVCGILRDPARRTNVLNPGRERRWLGAGIYRCGVCGDGTTLRAFSQTSGRTAYTCKSAKHLTADQERLDSYVRRVIEGRLARPDVADLLPGGPNKAEVDKLNQEATVLRERLAQVERDYDEGLIDARRLKAATAKTEEKLEAVTSRLAGLQADTRLGALLAHRDPAEAFRGADVEAQAVALDALVSEVVILPARRGRPTGWTPGAQYLDPDRVQIVWRAE